LNDLDYLRVDARIVHQSMDFAPVPVRRVYLLIRPPVPIAGYLFTKVMTVQAVNKILDYELKEPT
jgi:hypothetical protein